MGGLADSRKFIEQKLLSATMEPKPMTTAAAARGSDKKESPSSSSCPYSSAPDGDRRPLLSFSSTTAAAATKLLPLARRIDGAYAAKQQRERERKRRARIDKKSKVACMASQVGVLETAASALAALSGEDAAWDDFLDEDARRVRTFLRRSLQLTREVARLADQRATLQRLLSEHELWAAAARTLAHSDASDNVWASCVMRWHALSLAYFKPWTIAQCLTQIDAAVREMNAFAWRRDTTSTDWSLMCWFDERRLDRAKASIQFCFLKTFRGSDLLRHVDFHWDVYTQTALYTRIVLGGHALASVEVLQRVAPNMFIVRYDERYAGEFLNVHILYLLFRVETPRGFVLCLRSIESPEVQRATATHTDCWTTDLVWLRWELLEGKSKDDEDLQCTDYLQSVGGSLMGDDLSYASRWLFEALAAVIRADMASTNKPSLQF